MLDPIAFVAEELFKPLPCSCIIGGAGHGCSCTVGGLGAGSAPEIPACPIPQPG